MYPPTNAYYFGCWGEPGHYLWKPGKVHAWDAEREGILPWREVDGRLPPARRDRDRRGDGRRPVLKEAPQGHAALHWKDGWTALAFWDRSVDKRGGCNSNFFIRGTHSFEDAVRIARKEFPSVWARFPFDVVLVQEPSGERPEAAMSLEEKAADYGRLRDRVRELEAELASRGGGPPPPAGGSGI